MRAAVVGAVLVVLVPCVQAQAVDVALAPPTQRVQLDHAMEATVGLDVRNGGQFNETYAFNLSGVPDGWSVDGLPETLGLAPWTTRHLSFRVRGPAEVPDRSWILVISVSNVRLPLDRDEAHLVAEAPPDHTAFSAPIGKGRAVQAVHDVRSGGAADFGWLGFGAAFGIGGGALVVPRLRFRLAAWLFGARLARRRDAILSQAARRGIVELVGHEPGIHFSEARRRLGLATGALAYHLRVLEPAGAITSAHDGLRRRLYPGPGPHSVAPSLSLTERAIAALLRARPGIDQREVGRALGLGKHRTSYWVGKLARRGYLEATRAGRTRRLYWLGQPPNVARAYQHA